MPESLKQKTQVLDYSGKGVDPLTLVECDVADATVEADGSIDLAKVGNQDVVYTITADKEKAKKTCRFTVRDTHAPEIALAEQAIDIQQGGGFDPVANIASVADPVDGALPQVSSEPAVEVDGDSGASTASAVSSGSSVSAGSTEPGSRQLYESGWYLIDGALDAATPGTYAYTVLACDKHGNRASKQFQVTVVAEPAPEPAVEEVPVPVPAADVHAYVLNTNTHKFHIPGCSSVKQMKGKNRQDVEMTRDEVIAMGYDPCQRCFP